MEPNTDPEALGCPTFAHDFPVCTGTVTYPERGYKTALGWVQLVCSTDNASEGAEFEMDPFEPLGPTPHPFCFFGLSPVLFDAPARRSLDDLDWRAETFLCFVPMQAEGRETRAILGFSWGFTIREKTISLTSPSRLGPEDWNKHRAFLERKHPGWAFADGYRDQ